MQATPRRASLPASRVALRFASLLLAAPAFALGPHELLVLANGNSSRSVTLAREYAAQRRVPPENVLLLDLAAAPPLELTPDECRRQILTPALRAADERGLAGHVLAWAYSLDFPIRVTATPPLSLQGLTFLRGRLPDPDAVANATYASPLFAGPDTPAFAGFPAQSLDVQRAWLGKNMPIPSMMLGFAGPRGNTPEEIAACLRRGLDADRGRPEGTVYFVTNSDVRSLCRQWQFPAAVRELDLLGVRAVITPTLPEAAPDILGAMLGAADVSMPATRRFLPGAMAEHLTSFGAAFDAAPQTKISEWIRAGAGASAGTVTEPMSAWPKFPHARYFAHLASGCTSLEAFHQALKCPLQILLLGDPLSSPWAPRSTLTIEGPVGQPLRGRAKFHARIAARDGDVFNRFRFLLDGRPLAPLGTEPGITLDAAVLAPGPHRLRAVAHKVGSVRAQIFAERELTVP
jgi:hypothetical protein